MSSHELLDDFTVVYAQNQTKGKGQLGSKWEVKNGKNLTFSVFFNASFLEISHQFYLNCAVSLSVYNVLKRLLLPQLSIKWPNDILSGNKKISGILVENIIKSTSEVYSVIGIGLNVNQIEFDPMFKASSLKNIIGNQFNLDELLILLVSELKVQLEKLRSRKFEELHLVYEDVLFRKNKPSTFKNVEGQIFLGFIKNVTPNGKLQILLEDDVLKEFRLKEVSLLY